MRKILLQSFCFSKAIICFLIVGLLILFSGCAHKNKISRYPKGTYRPYKVGSKTYYPLPTAFGFEEVGYASWYGPKFHGKKTASGEVYNMYGLTAAHKILPMNTYVRVENLENHRSVVVRINDRGPFVKNRIIDLSYEAAKRLGIIGPGTAKVRLVALGEVKSVKDKEVVFNKIPNFANEDFYVQVGAFLMAENAYNLKKKLEKRFKVVSIHRTEVNGLTFYKVQVDAPNDYKRAKAFEQMLEEAGFQGAFLIAR